GGKVEHIAGAVQHPVRRLSLAEVGHDILDVVEDLVPLVKRLDVDGADVLEAAAAQLCHKVSSDKATAARKHDDCVSFHLAAHLNTSSTLAGALHCTRGIRQPTDTEMSPTPSHTTADKLVAVYATVACEAASGKNVVIGTYVVHRNSSSSRSSIRLPCVSTYMRGTAASLASLRRHSTLDVEIDYIVGRGTRELRACAAAA